jgi:polar amino acid transport system substrate-binding protein
VTIPILKLVAKSESDLLVAKFRAGQIASMAGFSPVDRSRLIVAVSEIVRNALTFAGEARIEFSIRNEDKRQYISVVVSDDGPGFSLEKVDPNHVSGISACKKLVEDLRVEAGGERGCKVTILKAFCRKLQWVTCANVEKWIEDLKTNSPFSVVDDLEQQNKQLIDTLQEVERYRSKLEERTEQLNQANKYKAEFLANMSHEIRTPMNAVIGLSNILDRTALTFDQKKYLRLIKDAGSSLLDIINDILDFSKIEAGKLNIENVEFELFDNIETCVELLSANAQAKGLALVCGIDPQLPKLVIGDGVRLRQILVNFINNAIKFTASGGQVMVKCKLVSKDGRDVRVRFEVTDSGIGLSEEQMQKLFKPFVQADGSTTRKYGGTGLGLSICKQLVDLMKGSIGVESVLGLGSTFWFELPFLAARGRHLGDGAQLFFKRALIVDDNSATREVLSTLLSSWDMECETAESGIRALELIDAKEFDLFIVDYLMPGMNGLELTSALKSHKKVKNAQILLLTALQDETLGQKAIEGGCDAFLTKPIRQDLFLECLCTLKCSVSQKMKTGKFYGTDSSLQFGSGTVAESTNLAVAELPMPAQASSPQPVDAKAAAGESVLLVEDNPTNQIIAQIELSTLDLKVTIASNGAEAIDALAREPFAIVFMDCQMPVMDGYAATKQIRIAESRSGRHVPIIAMTANAMEGDREKCLAAGMDDYISKPFEPEILRALVAKWIKSNSAIEKTEEVTGPLIMDYDKFRGRFNESQSKQLLTVFLADTEDKLPKIMDMIQKKELDAMGKLAHGVKGAAAMIFADALAAVAKELEMNGKTGNAAPTEELGRKLKVEFERLKAFAADKV